LGSQTSPVCTFDLGFEAQGTAITVNLITNAKKKGQIGQETVILDDFKSKANSKAKESKAHSESDDSGDESDNLLDVISPPAAPQ
jgi:hypothetical protein